MSEECEKLREEAPWVPCVGRIGIWNFPPDDDGMDASSSRWTISMVGQQTGIYFLFWMSEGRGTRAGQQLNTWTEKGRARASCQRLEGGRI
jgi:hypothetical protein